MRHPIDEPHQEFSSILDNSELMIEVIDSFKAFASKTKPESLPDNEYYESSSIAYDKAKATSLGFTVLTGTLLLYIAGQFEQFIKECMKIVADEYAAKCSVFTDLPESTQASLIRLTSEAILKPTAYNYSKDDIPRLVSQLAATINAKDGLVEINKDCLVYTDTNMRPDALSDILKRFEIKDVWKDISKQLSMKTYLGTDNDVETEKKAREMLNEIMEERNKIAHPSSNPEFPDGGKVKKYLTYLRELSKVFSELMIHKCLIYKAESFPQNR